LTTAEAAAGIILSLFGSRRLERELDDEFAFHLAMRERATTTWAWQMTISVRTSLPVDSMIPAVRSELLRVERTAPSTWSG
jgi:hypothetical protein